jgi:hypothetical protein
MIISFFSQIGNGGLAKAPPPIDVPALSLDELKEKTDDFGSNTLVGEGSYGRVYYAVLENGQHAAVKKLDASADPEPDNEFLAQVFTVALSTKLFTLLYSTPSFLNKILIGQIIFLTLYTAINFLCRSRLSQD